MHPYVRAKYNAIAFTSIIQYVSRKALQELVKYGVRS